MRHNLFTGFYQAGEWLWAPSAILVPIATCGSSAEKNKQGNGLFFIKALSWRSDHISQTPPSGLIMLSLAPRGFPWQYLEDILSGLKVHVSHAGSQGQGSQPAAPELTGTILVAEIRSQWMDRQASSLRELVISAETPFQPSDSNICHREPGSAGVACGSDGQRVHTDKTCWGIEIIETNQVSDSTWVPCVVYVRPRWHLQGQD